MLLNCGKGFCPQNPPKVDDRCMSEEGPCDPCLIAQKWVRKGKSPGDDALGCVYALKKTTQKGRC